MPEKNILTCPSTVLNAKYMVQGDTMENQNANTGKKQKSRTYMLTMRQALSVKPQYDIYRDGMKAVYAIEGDVTRHVFTIRKDGIEVLCVW